MAGFLDQVVSAVTGDLRVALAVAGGALLLGLAGWEIWQRRRARKADDAHVAGAYGRSRGAAADLPDPLFVEEVSEVRIVGAQETRGSRDDLALDLPEIGARDPLMDPPVVDLEAALRPSETGRTIRVVDSVTLTDEPDDEPDARPAAPAPSAAPAASAPVTPPPVETSPPDHGPSPVCDAATATAAAVAPAATPAARVDRLADDARRVVGLRIVARNGERFTGAAVRQALQGEGFVHGDMQIFHRSSGDGRVLMSAASLTRPGSFDLAAMDPMLYRGLNLFAVLPGPLPGRDTVDKLLLTGHTLAQRLRGELQDSRGEPLTEARLSEMRREAAAAPDA